MEEKKKIEKKENEELFNIEEYCNIKNLDKYYLDFLLMSFGNKEKKTVKRWTEFLLKNELIKEELIK